ncbi:hypothetical protein PAAG_02549 [Paracoccidioides lutzii Pb01]|uniref:Uncharacterized protein n=1 Tax=Paracoccidioides lutzii (strain ATCC MYA-826 / Pb01) TaxID=502779 RepID=C1GV76_PARBA|nr:hypothetical protein PAAG_02549 [Paracoccidioides lutzii Pb01]EEH40494.2 hypothetical protein PAAG_02549 [Paracoccidioides lutzii Pb01]
MRKCIICESPEPGEQLIDIEYMISQKLNEKLPEKEQLLWHSHEYEALSAKFEKVKKIEFLQLSTFYSKVYHLWQINRADQLPMGEPQLMASVTSDKALNKALPSGKAKLKESHKSIFGEDVERALRRRIGPKVFECYALLEGW